jgi:hypothetical protein
MHSILKTIDEDLKPCTEYKGGVLERIAPEPCLVRGASRATIFGSTEAITLFTICRKQTPSCSSREGDEALPRGMLQCMPHQSEAFTSGPVFQSFPLHMANQNSGFNKGCVVYHRYWTPCINRCLNRDIVSKTSHTSAARSKCSAL